MSVEEIDRRDDAGRLKRPVMPFTAMIPISRLIIDERYQRELEESRSRKIAREYEEKRFGLICVSTRGQSLSNALEGGFPLFVVDGQHRFRAAQILGFVEIPCAIYEEKHAAGEADFFAKLQHDRKGLSAVDRFRAQVFAEYPDSMDINSVVTDLGMTIDRQRHTPTTISAVISLERIYKRWGKEHLRYTLMMSREIWQGEDGSLQGAFLDGFARFLAAYGDERFTDEVKNRLKIVSPMALMRRASAIRGGGSQMGHLIEAQLRKLAKIKGRPRTKIKKDSK